MGIIREVNGMLGIGVHTLSKFIQLFAATALAVVCLASPLAGAQDVIKIGIPLGLSGANSVVAPAVVQSAELAVEEINAKGGILGKKVMIEVADDGSSAAGAQKAFDALLFQKKVDVIITMETSAARNAGLPIVSRAKKPFIYTSLYEGHSCNPYLYVNAWVPDQQVAPIVDYFMKKYSAKTYFLIGNDYAFGRGMLDFTRKYIKQKGGKVLGEEYLPMDGSDWTAIIGKLKAAKPDALITSTACGAPNVTLTKQLRAAGVNIPYGNLSVDEGTAMSMGADAVDIYISASYLISIDTPKNKEFLAAMQKKFGTDLKMPNDVSVPEYDGVYAYKLAVEKAGTTDAAKVIPALAKVSFDGPRGVIRMNKQHHAPLTMYLGQVQKDGSVKMLATYKDVDPGDQCPKLK